MPGIGHNSRRKGPTYAIVFDLDDESLKDAGGGLSSDKAHAEVREFLMRRGFGWQRGSTYFGDERVDAVACVLLIQDLTDEFGWFAPAVRDIRMLRIQDNEDLMPAVERAARRRSSAVQLEVGLHDSA